MTITGKDKTILRELGKQVAEIAALPEQQETISLWKSLNSLKPKRPMVMIDQIPWHEMDVNGELSNQTEDSFSQALETELRRTIYKWNHMRTDMVVDPVIDISKAINGWDLGISVQEHTASSDPNNSVVGHFYIDQMKTEDDINKIKTPEITHDEETTRQKEENVHDIFDGILTVRTHGFTPSFALWDAIATWRGAEAILYDLADRPEFTHELMTKLTNAYLAGLDQLEEKGLLDHHQNTIHCSGAHTDELPASGFNPDKPRAKDIWTCGMAQIFSTVSPAMHEEFELNYATKWYSRFGLVYYGCCEPLHDKISIIRKIPHLKKISMSPWVDIEKGAEQIGGDFIFSRKPNPAFLATDTWNKDIVQNDIIDVMKKCQHHGCPLEFILKDISTVHYEPKRLWEWADLVMRQVKQ